MLVSLGLEARGRRVRRAGRASQRAGLVAEMRVCVCPSSEMGAHATINMYLGRLVLSLRSVEEKQRRWRQWWGLLAGVSSR